MKNFLLLVGLLFTAPILRAQGTINFANGAAGVNARLVLPGTGPLAGPDWQAQLQVFDGLRFNPSGLPEPFQEGIIAGYFLGGLRVIRGIAQGSQVQMRVRVFSVAGNLEGVSEPITVTLGGDKSPPANLVGLQPWSLSQPRLTVLSRGGQLELSWPASLAHFGVQTTTRLPPSTWTFLPGAPSRDGDRLVLRVPSGTGTAFFRLALSN